MIRTENLTKHFGPKVAVNSLDLEVHEGEFFCFLGPNGAGKTTTIRMLTGLIKPTQGRAFIRGLDIQQSPLEAKALIGYIPDAPFLYEKLTGREFMRFVAGLYRMPEDHLAAKCEELLELFEIREVGRPTRRGLQPRNAPEALLRFVLSPRSESGRRRRAVGGPRSEEHPLRQGFPQREDAQRHYSLHVHAQPEHHRERGGAHRNHPPGPPAPRRHPSTPSRPSPRAPAPSRMSF